MTPRRVSENGSFQRAHVQTHMKAAQRGGRSGEFRGAFRSSGTARPHQQYEPDFGNGARYPAFISSILKPPLQMRYGISRVTWQPSNASRKTASGLSRQRQTLE